MQTLSKKLFRWMPAIFFMGLIFWFSSQPPSSLPDFDWADRIIKKGGHMLGYAMLALSYWSGLELRPDKRWVAWFFAMLFAVTDEYHQSFITGRNASAWDVIVFDNLGALIAIGLARVYKEQRPAQPRDDRLEL